MAGLNFMPDLSDTDSLSPLTRSLPALLPGDEIELKWPLCQEGIFGKFKTWNC